MQRFGNNLKNHWWWLQWRCTAAYGRMAFRRTVVAFYVTSESYTPVSFAKACKRPSVRSWCSTTFCVKSAPRHCAREPFKSIWRLYRKILDQSKRVPSHERTVHTVLLQVDTNAYSLRSILMPHLLPCALPLMLAKHGNVPTKMITHLAHEATCTFKVCFAHCLLVESSL